MLISGILFHILWDNGLSRKTRDRVLLRLVRDYEIKPYPENLGYNIRINILACLISSILPCVYATDIRDPHNRMGLAGSVMGPFD
jgi:hypothetical protein